MTKAQKDAAWCGLRWGILLGIVVCLIARAIGVEERERLPTLTNHHLLRTNWSRDIRVTNWSRLDPKIVQQWCAEHGGHCFTNYHLQGIPNPQGPEKCKHCGYQWFTGNGNDTRPIRR